MPEFLSICLNIQGYLLHVLLLLLPYMPYSLLKREWLLPRDTGVVAQVGRALMPTLPQPAGNVNLGGW